MNQQTESGKMNGINYKDIPHYSLANITDNSFLIQLKFSDFPTCNMKYDYQLKLEMY